MRKTISTALKQEHIRNFTAEALSEIDVGARHAVPYRILRLCRESATLPATVSQIFRRGWPPG